MAEILLVRRATDKGVDCRPAASVDAWICSAALALGPANVSAQRPMAPGRPGAIGWSKPESLDQATI